ncbi:MAG: hypothetical protein E7565_02500 [Ruminococcaceae bacterium]|nr:hypothetical protein [Oscillospiraceae bacterium]
MVSSALPTYFLTANSADGFINGFKSVYDANDGWRVFLIKGGPGTGKSTFMKNVAQALYESGEEVHLVPCSSDPNSLDGVVSQSKKICFFDATAPHILNPEYAGVCEETIDLGVFWDSDKLYKEREKIIELTDKNKELHRLASKMISAVGQLKRKKNKDSLMATDIDKTFDYAATLTGRFLKDGYKTGKERVIYLSAITNEGEIFINDTVDKLCDRKIFIEDGFGTVAGIITSVIRDWAIDKNIEIITVKNNILPSEQIDHILIPSLSFAFVSGKGHDAAEKKINSLRFMDREVLKEHRSAVKVMDKLSAEFTLSAVEILKKAKLNHDELESYYVSAMDFSALNKFTSKFTEKLLLY